MRQDLRTFAKEHLGSLARYVTEYDRDDLRIAKVYYDNRYKSSQLLGLSRFYLGLVEERARNRKQNPRRSPRRTF